MLAHLSLMLIASIPVLNWLDYRREAREQSESPSFIGFLLEGRPVGFPSRWPLLWWLCFGGALALLAIEARLGQLGVRP